MKIKLVAALAAFAVLFGTTASPAQAFTGQNIKSSSSSQYQLYVEDDYYKAAWLSPGNSTAGFGFNDVDWFYVAKDLVAISPWNYKYDHGWHKVTIPNGTTLTLTYVRRYVNV